MQRTAQHSDWTITLPHGWNHIRTTRGAIIAYSQESNKLRFTWDELILHENEAGLQLRCLVAIKGSVPVDQVDQFLLRSCGNLGQVCQAETILLKEGLPALTVYGEYRDESQKQMWESFQMIVPKLSASPFSKCKVYRLLFMAEPENYRNTIKAVRKSMESLGKSSPYAAIAMRT
jgi:hypothetical protein